jgi:hypothetical protein
MPSFVKTPLRALLTMGEIYGHGLIYAPRAHPRTCDWIPRDSAMLDGLTGGQLTVAGGMAVVCSRGVTTPLGLELLADAGLRTGSSIHTYRDEEDAIEIAAELAASGRKIVVQHIYPDGVLNEGGMWIEGRLLSYLNNKANLAELVPAEHVARREVIAVEKFFDDGPTRELPVVLKVATELSTGGGADVAICRTGEELQAARARFAGCGRLVVERCESVVRDVCLHFAVMPNGTSQYLGFADQDIDENGRYRGNWISLGSKLPEEVVEIGLETVERGAKLGYRGLLGIDIVGTEDGRWVVMDLNFRVNGSSAAVLLAPSIHRMMGACLLHLRSFTCEGGFAKLVAIARTAQRSGRLIPLASLDTTLSAHVGRPARLSALVVGDSKAEAHQVEADLAASGLV